MKNEDFKKAIQERYSLDQKYFQIIDKDEEPTERLLANCYKTRASCMDIIKYCEQKGIKIDIKKL